MPEEFLVVVIKIAVLAFIIITAVAYVQFVERRVMAFMQARLGPNRVGPLGLLQPLADILKLIFKEDMTPAGADVPVYFLAPALAAIVAIAAFAVIPFGSSISVLGYRVNLYVADINVGLLYVFAMSSLAVYGVTLAGWSSNNKYSLLGGIRSSAQMISYELPLGLALVSVLLLAGSLSLVDIVRAQSGLWFIVLQPLGFIIYFICAVAETNRAPFDLPEAESELIAGYHTEYSSMKWALFFLAEYIAVMVQSAVAITLYFGGWNGPFVNEFPLLGILWFVLKLTLFILVFTWMRATLPRLRYDQLMRFGWKVLMPLAVLNLIVTAGLVAVIGS
ncbi:MAG: NADH-quinone oxidoreductase subunit NuoH [Chloroflexi bacterium]|nr:MAG: NADH-quinone oxidoreductase subunit NuoH [Chloroflexota bacterium]